jgi:simple sugar transport system substrate-binding protein
MVGNWYDNQKGMELAKAMMEQGADVILPIAGSAGLGVLSAVQAAGRYALWFDSSAYALAKGTVVGCAVLRQERLVYESVKAAIEGRLEYGKPRILGVRDGYVDFDDQDPLYSEVVPAEIRDRFAPVLADLRSGALTLETASF